MKHILNQYLIKDFYCDRLYYVGFDNCSGRLSVFLIRILSLNSISFILQKGEQLLPMAVMNNNCL